MRRVSPVISAWLWVAMAAPLAGCGDGPVPGDASPTPIVPDARSAAVEMGSDDGGFVRLLAEQSLPLLEGIQGGHHFLLHVRIRGLEPGEASRPGSPGNPATGFSAFDEGGDQVDVMASPYRLGFVSESGGWFAWLHPRTLIVLDDRVSSIDGRRVRLRVEVTDSRGQSVFDEVWVRAEVVPLRDASADPGSID